MTLKFRYIPQNQDIETIKDIVESTNFFYDYEIPVAIELVQEYLEKGSESGYEFVFASIENKVVGYSCYGQIACTNGSYDLYWIVVHNNYRGKGFGKIILSETEKKVKENGGRILIAETSSQEKYISTQKFYETNNYICEAKINDFYEIGDGKLIFVKRL